VRIDSNLRSVLRRAAEMMIPSGVGLPSAIDVGIDAELLDRVLAVRPDLEEPLAAALHRLRDVPTESILTLLDTEPGLEVLGIVVAGGYLMSEPVAAALDYPWQEAKLVRPDDVYEALQDGLLDAVVERGPIYRLPPDAPADAVAEFNS
jgi:hypothetical protein